jgi:hypothetical protein
MKKFGVYIVVCICSALYVACAGMHNRASTVIKNETSKGRGLEYTCRIQNGDILVSTQADIANSSEDKKARAFNYKKAYNPVDITDYDVLEKNAALEWQL